MQPFGQRTFIWSDADISDRKSLILLVIMVALQPSIHQSHNSKTPTSEWLVARFIGDPTTLQPSPALLIMDIKKYQSW